MQLVERHVVKQSHPDYDEIDEAAFASKNLYNLTTYTQRQHFFETGGCFSYYKLYCKLRDTDAYRGLPRKVSQQVLRQSASEWKSYFEARREYNEHPEKFQAPPSIPGYKDKQQGRNLLTYTIQAVSKRQLDRGYVKPSGLGILINTQQEDIDQVRVVPKKNHYVVEVVYTVEPVPADLDYDLVAGIDIGLDNLAAIASNKRGFQPLVVNGRPLKSMNQYYNKRKAEMQSKLRGKRKTSRRIQQLTAKRNFKVNHYLHVASRRVIDLLVSEGIGTLVIGKNDGWKNEINIGKRNNQNFVTIPHARFIEMLTYKAKLVGIRVILVEESYTSKTSFLDGEEPVKHETYAGRRVKRGLFRASDGRHIHADVNGAYQIIVKAIPDAFDKRRDRGCVVHPLRLDLSAVAQARLSACDLPARCTQAGAQAEIAA